MGVAGPNAPTLCAGWTTADLAAHLLVRERDPRAIPGILFPNSAFARLTARLMQKAKASGYPSMLDKLRRMPPTSRFPASAQVNENFVHHEDVRRARGDEPRRSYKELDDALWRALRRFARLSARQLGPVGLELVTPDGRQAIVRKRPQMATLIGAPGELCLYLNGRKSVAVVSFDGPLEAIEALRSARFGL